MSWAWIVATTVFLGLLWVVFRAGAKSAERKSLKQANREKDQELDAMVKAAHQQEKREADHEARVAEIIRGHGLDIGRINRMLNDYPSTSEAPGPVQQKSVSP